MNKAIDRAQVLACIEQGMSNRRVAETVGCSVGWVSALRKELNVQAKHGRPRIDRTRVAECIASGKTMKQTAAEIGCSVIAVAKIKQELNLSNKPKEFPVDDFLVLRKESITNKELAERLDLSIATIYKYQHILGLTSKPSHISKYAKFSDMFSAGMTKEEITDSLKISSSSYYQYRCKYLRSK